ncbi:MAG: ATP-binding protein [Thermoleophilia bacterium]
MSEPTREGVLERRLDRERRARLEAEEIAERVTGELSIMISDLERSSAELGAINRSLAASEARFRTLVDSIPQAVYSAPALDRPPTFLSDAIAGPTGFAPADLVGTRPLASLVHPDDLPAYRDAIRDAQAAGGSFVANYRVVRPDGEVRWVLERGQVTIGEDGARRVDGTLDDVTAQVLAAAERERIETELRVAHKLESVGELAAGIAHEINTPIQFVGDSVRFLSGASDDLLALVATYREALAATAPPDVLERAREAEERADLAYLEERLPSAAARAQEGIDRVSTIVKAMKAFSHSGSSEAAPADLNEAIRTTLVVATHEYKYVAEVETDLAEGLPQVHCTIGELNQVFLNLVVNAAHAIGDAREGMDGKGTIRVSTRLDGDDVVVAVADDGTGIPPEVRERVFDPFFTTKTVGKGSGQGLALARSVVERHGGSLTFETEIGRGTTFRVRVPVGAAAAQLEAAA